MNRSCESSNAHSSSEHPMATNSTGEIHRNADSRAHKHNNIIAIARLLAVVLENDVNERPEVSS